MNEKPIWTCPHCKGDGFIHGQPFPCRMCGGAGEQYAHTRPTGIASLVTNDSMRCDKCGPETVMCACDYVAAKGAAIYASAQAKGRADAKSPSRQ